MKIVLESTASGFRYPTTKNERTHPERLELRKYDPVVRRHVWFKESK